MKGVDFVRRKIIYIMTIAILLVLSCTTIVNAELKPGDLDGTTSSDAVTAVTKVGNNVIGILTTVGVVLSVIVLIVIGIKYMMGSAEEKAEYKKTMIPYIIGAALIFAASAIATVVYNFMNGISAS